MSVAQDANRYLDERARFSSDGVARFDGHAETIRAPFLLGHCRRLRRRQCAIRHHVAAARIVIKVFDQARRGVGIQMID